MGIRGTKRIINAQCPMPHAPCPMPHAPCPIPYSPFPEKIKQLL
ncbi:histidine kinase [Nostoc sp.]